MSSLLDEDGFIIFETGDAGQGFDAEAGVFQGLAAALEGLFDDDADAGDGTTGLSDNVRQAAAPLARKSSMMRTDSPAWR